VSRVGAQLKVDIVSIFPEMVKAAFA